MVKSVDTHLVLEANIQTDIIHPELVVKLVDTHLVLEAILLNIHPELVVK